MATTTKEKKKKKKRKNIFWLYKIGHDQGWNFLKVVLMRMKFPMHWIGMLKRSRKLYFDVESKLLQNASFIDLIFFWKAKLLFQMFQPYSSFNASPVSMLLKKFVKD